jgi:NADH-quinone oxidoreductase subunit C
MDMTDGFADEGRELCDAIQACWPEAHVSRSALGETTWSLAPDTLLSVARILQADSRFSFEQLMDVTAVDYLAYGKEDWVTEMATATGFSRARGEGHQDPAVRPRLDGRFEVVYHLLSVSRNERLRLKVFLPPEGPPLVPSLTGIWASADWFEREVFDLFGILFDGHPDLRRILTDYGFIGHPFRKDFPLSGEVEVRYDPESGRVVYEPVSITPRTLVPRVIRNDARYPSTGPGKKEPSHD